MMISQLLEKIFDSDIMIFTDCGRPVPLKVNMGTQSGHIWKETPFINHYFDTILVLGSICP